MKTNANEAQENMITDNPQQHGILYIVDSPKSTGFHKRNRACSENKITNFEICTHPKF